MSNLIGFCIFECLTRSFCVCYLFSALLCVSAMNEIIRLAIVLLPDSIDRTFGFLFFFFFVLFGCVSLFL